LAERAEIGDGAQRAADEPLDLLRSASGLRGARRALAGRARQHAVLRGHPALLFPAQPVGDPILDGGGAQHAGAPHRDQRRALGVRQHPALELEPAGLRRLATVVAPELGGRGGAGLTLANRPGLVGHALPPTARRFGARSNQRRSFWSTTITASRMISSAGSSRPRKPWATRWKLRGSSLRKNWCCAGPVDRWPRSDSSVATARAASAPESISVTPGPIRSRISGVMSG